MTKEYKCECGKVFDNPQKFNGHKRHCKVHLNKAGKLNQMLTADTQIAKKSSVTQRQKYTQLRQQKLELWINEQHTCEKCGKVMTEKFGSGRFCSKVCANSHSKSDSSRIKVSQTLRGRSLTEEEITKLLEPKVIKQDIIYNGPELPTIVDEHLKSGYFPRNRMSYAEKFWKSVLDNNGVTYTHDFVVQKPKGERGVFRLDFLIDNVDVEIDGEQHYDKRAIVEKDARRDAYLTEKGFTVYRIRWVNPVSERNKLIVNQQIEELFEFIDKPRLV